MRLGTKKQLRQETPTASEEGGMHLVEEDALCWGDYAQRGYDGEAGDTVCCCTDGWRINGDRIAAAVAACARRGVSDA